MTLVPVVNGQNSDETHLNQYYDLLHTLMGIDNSDVRLYRSQASVLTLDDGLGGDGHLIINGGFYADSLGGGEYNFKVDQTTGRVRIGGGGGAYLFSAGGRSPTQIEFAVGDQAMYFKSRLSTAITLPVNTDASFSFQPTDWNAGASRDNPGTIALRADGLGSAYWILDAPGNEMFHLFATPHDPQGSSAAGGTAYLHIRQETIGDVLAAYKPSEANQRMRLGINHLTWGPGTTTALDTRIRRSTAKTVEIDDNAGGNATLNVVGTLSENGRTVTPELDLFVGPWDSMGRNLAGVAVAANLAIFQAFQVNRAVTVNNCHFMPTAQAGNIDVAIYSAAGTRLGSTGSTACPAANARATVALTGAVALVPGVKYYAGFSSNNAGAAFAGITGQTVFNQGDLLAAAARATSVAATFPLPSSVTIGTATASGLYYYVDFD